MSYDLYFWPAGTAGDPELLTDRLAEEEAEELAGDARVLAFRAEILRRWPELADQVSPWHTDLDWRQPWGRTDLADRYAALTLSHGWAHTEDLPDLAHAHGLDCYDPQLGQLLRRRGRLVRLPAGGPPAADGPPGPVARRHDGRGAGRRSPGCGTGEQDRDTHGVPLTS